MKQLSISEMQSVEAGSPARGCIIGSLLLIGTIATAIIETPVAVAAGAIWVGTFIGSVTATALDCAEWAAGV